MRGDIADKVSEFSDKVRERPGNPKSVTGTRGDE